MNHSHETNPETIQKKAITGVPVGNKLKKLIDGEVLVDIDREVAESFISSANAHNGLLPFLQAKNVDFNKRGIYKLKYSLLRDIFGLMESIGAEYLNFNFVEIDPKHAKLDLESVAGTDSMIYMVASLKRNEGDYFEDQHYLLINAKDSQKLSDLNITDQEKCPLENKFLNKSYGIFKEYFMDVDGKNTQSIDYHIEDLRKTLEKEDGNCNAFNVYLCQISNVAEVIKDIIPTAHPSSTYDTHFKNREKQTTLVFYSGTDYYDMGSLRP